MPVYRHYDQTALDAQYNNRARVPDFTHYAERWQRASEAARVSMDCYPDIAYGSGPRQRLDIFPCGAGPAPALVFIHGGYWQSFDKSCFLYPAPAMVGNGVAFVALGYPIAPEAGMDDIVDSVRMALAWLWRHGRDYGIDPDRISVSGHSAGGHLTAMAMATDWPRREPDLPADLVKTGCAISGLYDLEPIRLSYLNEKLDLDAATARRNSPVNNLPRASGSLRLAVGGAESEEYLRQQSDYHTVWTAAGLPGDALILEKRNHFSIVDRLDDPDDAMFRAATEMVTRGGG